MKYSVYQEEVYYLRDDINDFFTVFHFGKTLSRPDYQFTHYQEPYHLFEYVINNVGYVEHDNQIERVTRGDFYYLNKNGKMHCYADKDEPYEKFFISIYGKLIDNLVSAFFDDHNCGVIHTGERSAQIERIFGDLCGLMSGLDTEQNRRLHAKRMQEVSVLIYRMLAESVGEECFMLPSQNLSTATLARRWIDDTILERITLDMIADRLHVSVAHLIRIFREKYGITPKQYMLERKIAYSKMLLTDTPMSISEIAEKLNFSDATYFSSVFRRFAAMTPSQYRAVERPENYLAK